MEVTITHLRKNLFSLAEQALDGKPVVVTHKGRKLRLAAAGPPKNKLKNITPMEIWAPGVDTDRASWKAELMAEMQREWEEDWAQL